MLYGRRVAKSIKGGGEENVYWWRLYFDRTQYYFCLYCLFNVVCRFFPCTAHRFAFGVFLFTFRLSNVFLYKQDRKGKKNENVIRLLVPPADQLMWTLPALDIVCLLVYTLRALGATKDPMSSVIRTRMHRSSEIPLPPYITRIGAVSRWCISFLALLSFGDLSRDILQFALRRSCGE